jgi:hypothetical protein
MFACTKVKTIDALTVQDFTHLQRSMLAEKKKNNQPKQQDTTPLYSHT